ncbi:MAG: hypothetical protein QF886_16485, partial [Planctomycetota bacterium]|nr:hypothetical protein [Planctomycetota bacterium]
MRHLILASVALLVSADVLLSETEPDFGFERANPNASPKHWRANAGAGHPLEVAKCITEEPPFVRSGKSAVKLVQTGKRKDGRPLIGHLYSIFTVPVKASAGYVIRFYARGNGQIGAAVYCYTLKDGQSAFSHTLNARADDVGARGGMIAVREENRWKLCSFRFTSPPMEKEVHEIRVVIRIRGTVYVDDSELSTEQSTQATPEEMKPVEGSFRTNLVSVICKASVPRIDGQIEEAEYSTRWTGLIENSSNSLYPQRGEFFLSGDLSRFYFGMAVQMPANYRLRARGKGRDDPALICDTDVFYFFFRRDAETEAKGFQGVYLAVSSKGVIYDAWEDIHWKEARCRRDASFNAEWKVKTNLKDDLWALELSVPWNDLGVTPRKAAQTFAIAFGLNLQGTQLTWQAFS